MRNNWTLTWFNWFPLKDEDGWFWAFNILPSISVDFQTTSVSTWLQITVSFLFWQFTIKYDKR